MKDNFFVHHYYYDRGLVWNMDAIEHWKSLRADEVFMEKFNKFKSGRRIKEGSETWTKIRRSEFKLKVPFIDGSGEESHIFYGFIDEIDKIDIDEYTAKYNKMRRALIEENRQIIDATTGGRDLKWNEYVEYEGKKYNLTPKVSDNIHMQDDCGGEYVYINKNLGFDTYKCNKCGDRIYDI